MIWRCIWYVALIVGVMEIWNECDTSVVEVYYTERFIMYSGVTKIFYRKTVGHVQTCRLGWVLYATPRPLYPSETRCSFYRWLCGPRYGFGRVRKILSRSKLDPRTVHPVAIRYTDCAKCRTNNTTVTRLMQVSKKSSGWYVVRKLH